MTESWGTDDTILAQTIFTKKEIPERGTLYNFDYIQVYFKDDNGNFVLQNEPDLSSYNTFITKEDIASFDKETYGKYMQRSVAEAQWEYHIVTQMQTKITPSKFFSSIIQDEKNQLFKGDCTVSAYFHTNTNIDFEENYKEQYDKEYAVKGFKIYDLLPQGMELESSSNEINNSFYVQFNKFPKIYNLNFKLLEEKDLEENSNTEIKITKNWKNTNRTRIEINTTFYEPILIRYSSVDWDGSSASFRYNFKYSISYDSFLEYGNVWTNYCYIDTIQDNVNFYRTVTLDNGYYDKDAIDIDDDGDITDKLGYAKAQTTIKSIISTHQDVQKSVKTDKSYYSTGTVESSLNSEYEYKLRVRTGQNDVTNLIIYDSLEEYALTLEGEYVPAYGDKDHWNGEFLGIDTNHAESKGYTVKTYYSENVEAGNLYDEAHSLNPEYIGYTNTTDKSKVKSLAFEYLDADGNPAIIPANSLTYILIKMKSPSDENITSLAYNGCRTQWQALDEFNQPVDFITGINSNIVKVSLPNSEKYYGSYLVKHEYYYRDYKGDLILENTVSEDVVSNIPIDTLIKAEEQNHIETNKNKQYTYTEDTGDITIQKDVTKEIIIKYVREEKYTTELPETGSTDNIKNLISITFFLLLGVTSFFIASKRKMK